MRDLEEESHQRDDDKEDLKQKVDKSMITENGALSSSLNNNTNPNVENGNIDYDNWPMRNIREPHDHDVLFGRGGGTNHHPGNKDYRKTVEDRKFDYVTSKRLDKPLVALDIIRQRRALVPPGRFLKLDEKTGLWNDVGDKKAREKTSQALREKAPELRKKYEDEGRIHPIKYMQNEDVEVSESDSKQQSETNLTEIFRDDEIDNKERKNTQEELNASGSEELLRDLGQKDMPLFGPVISYPHGREISSGSQGVAPPRFPPSRATSFASYSSFPAIPLPLGDQYRSLSQDQNLILGFDFDRLGSLLSLPLPIPSSPTSMSPFCSSTEQQRSSSLSSCYSIPLSRDHSLSSYPLRGTSSSFQLSQSSSSGSFWGSTNAPTQPPQIPAMSSRIYAGSRNQIDANHCKKLNEMDDLLSSLSNQESPRFLPGISIQVLPDRIQSWSSKSDVNDMASDPLPDNEIMVKTQHRLDKTDNEVDCNSHASSDSNDLRNSDVPRDVMKRMTSNQNEDMETKRHFAGEGRSIKRVALHRENEFSVSGPIDIEKMCTNKPKVLDNDLRSLSVSMEQSSLTTKLSSKIQEDSTKLY